MYARAWRGAATYTWRVRTLCMAAEPQTKKPRTMVKKIGTHSGSFHCDEALGCYLLRQTDSFKGAPVLRSRDPEVLQGLDVVIDVGGVYDPAINRFDHHQRGFEEVFGHGFHTKLSSAGLVYKHFGKEIVAGYLGLPIDSPDVQLIYLALYKNFMEAIDAIDNGVNQWEGSQVPKYINKTDLSARVGQLNPNWNEDQSAEALDTRFEEASQLTGQEFSGILHWLSKVWLPARAFVQQAIEARFDVDNSGEIIHLKSVCPWKEHLYELEAEMGLEKPIKFCLYEDTREKKWRVQAVSIGPGSFENRKSLQAAWRGLRDDKLSDVSGIPGCVFVHQAGFIGGNLTFEGVVEMARQSLS